MFKLCSKAGLFLCPAVCRILLRLQELSSKAIKKAPQIVLRGFWLHGLIVVSSILDFVKFGNGLLDFV
jgi:hypothetical protein